MSDLSQQAQSDALIGERLGSAQIERQLGAGGMSAVYLARQERPRRLVAIKVLRSSLAPGRDQWPIFLARFRREADAMAALDHANITPIYEFGEQDNLAYLVMPYLPDGSLADLLAREGPLPAERAVTAIEQVAAALDYAHQHKIIHRDVKPSNILIHPDGRLLLSDFGIARPLDKRELPSKGAIGRDKDSSLTMAGAALGTPDYMAPEQVLGEKVSPATDVYALGAVAYTLLAGYTPFGGGGAERTLARQLNEPPQPLRLDRPEIPSRVEEAIFWALAKNPADRPASAGALAKALRMGLRTGPLAAGAALLRRAGAAAPGGLGAREAFSNPETSRRHNTGTQPIADLGPIELTRMESSASEDSTVWDARYSARSAARSSTTNAAGNPVWPTATRRPGQSERAGGVRLSPALITGIAAAMLVIVVMAVLLGSYLSGGDPLSAFVGVRATNTPSATLAPTVTPTMTPSPTPTVPSTWLSVSTDSLTLGCSGGSETQHVTLTNQGTAKVGWVARNSGGYGVSVTPTSGTLRPQSSVTIAVRNYVGGVNFSSGGQLTISPTGNNSDNAGDSVTVTYTINCNQGG